MSKRPFCVLLAGFLLMQVLRLWQMEPEPEQEFLRQLGDEGSTIVCSGTIRRWEERVDGTICYYLESISNDIISNTSNSNASDQRRISKKQLTEKRTTNWKILVYDKESKIHFPVGSRVRVRGTLRYFERAVNPGMFDSRAYYRRKGIAAMAFAKQTEQIQSQEKLPEIFCRFRTAWKKTLFRGMDEKNAATASAILLGEKSGMDPNLKEEFQLGGIGHILAISSLHMSLLGIGLYQFLRKRGRSFWSAGLLGSSFLGLYVWMVGIGVSTMRALVMYFVKIGAEITGRTYDGWTALFLSAAVVTGIQPLYYTDSGFWLSFGAIAGILYWQEVWKNLTVNSTKKNQKMTKFTGVAVQMFLLPIQLFYQYEVSGYSILLNAVVIPLMPILLGSLLLGSFFLSGETLPVVGEMAWETGKILLKGTTILLEGYQRLCQIALKLPGARMIAGKPQIWKMAGYYLVLFLGMWIVSKRKGKGKGKQMTIVVALGLLLLFFPGSKKNELEIVMLDVGQGDGIALHLPGGKNILVDGGSLDVEELSKYRLEPYLKSRGINRLDYVFVTHGDQDHISGITQMLQRKERSVKIETLVVPVKEVWEEQLKELVNLAKQEKVRVVEIEEDQKISFPGGRLTCLQPGRTEDLEPGNVASMVLLLSYGKFDLLLTGDVEGEGERMLIEKQKEKIEVLKVAHHGSKNSTSQEFLAIIHPECALISAGKNNRYGHPHEEMLDRLSKEDVFCLCTIEMGAIRIRTDGKSYQIRGLCEEKETDIIKDRE